MRIIVRLILLFFSCTAFAGEKVARENENNYMNKLLDIASNPDRGSYSTIRKKQIGRFLFLREDKKKINGVKIKLEPIEGGVRVISEESSMVPYYYAELSSAAFVGRIYVSHLVYLNKDDSTNPSYSIAWENESGKWEKVKKPAGPVSFFMLVFVDDEKYVYINKTSSEGFYDISFKELFSGIGCSQKKQKSAPRIKVAFRAVDDDSDFIFAKTPSDVCQ